MRSMTVAWGCGAYAPGPNRISVAFPGAHRENLPCLVIGSPSIGRSVVDPLDPVRILHVNRKVLLPVHRPQTGGPWRVRLRAPAQLDSMARR